MNMIKVSFMVSGEVYRALQASAARASQALPVFVREVVFQACQIDAATLSAEPEMRAARLTPTKRAILTLLQNHKAGNPDAPYLTTGQLKGSLQQSDQGVYINTRALLRDGLIERGQNLNRSAEPGAPLKTYAISALGETSLSDDQARTAKAHGELQARAQAAYDSLAPVQPKADTDHAFKPNVHSALRYIAMASLGRAIESEADVDGMKASHARLCAAADADVASGAHTYGQILEKVSARIKDLGGFDAISERFNIG